MKTIKLPDLHIGDSFDMDTYGDAYAENIKLNDGDLVTHIHGVGATRSGKSKWLENLCHKLILKGVGFTLIDPQGALAQDLVKFCALVRVKHIPVVYIDPSREDYLVPFNPFYGGSDDVSVRVDRYVASTLKVWGEEEGEKPRLERWLTNIYTVFALGIITLNEVDTLLRNTNAGHQLRAKVINQIEKIYPEISAEFEELQDPKLRNQDFREQLESVRNRLNKFVRHPQIRRMMSSQKGNLDFADVFKKNMIVIANLSESAKFSKQNGYVLGSLIINELWAAARKYKKPPRHHFLFIDEVEHFLTPDLKDILDRGAGKGLHLGLFHQHLTQLKAKDQWTYDSVMGNAKIKIVFGGLTKENATIMADELFAGELSYTEIKDEITQTKFWPTLESISIESEGESQGRGKAEGSSMGTSMGLMTALDENFSVLPEPYRESLGESFSDSTSYSESSSYSRSRSTVPFYRLESFEEVSSRQFYSIEEQKNKAADALKLIPQRHYFMKRPGSKTTICVTPFVKERHMDPRKREKFVLEQFIKRHGRSIADIDQELAHRKQALLETNTSQYSNDRVESADDFAD